MLILGTYASKWNAIGTALRFNASELNSISAKPGLFHEGPQSYLREVLNQWVQWPNDTQKGNATVEALASALRSRLVGLGRVAEDLKLRLKQLQGNSA